MRSDARKTASFTGRCYCGATSVACEGVPVHVAYCHCGDCKRWTGSPLPAFAAFASDRILLDPAAPEPSFARAGVRRWHCATCGSPLAAEFDYLPGQTYVPVGIIEQSALLQPTLHCHADGEEHWLHLQDNLPRAEASGRAALLASGS